MPFKADPATIRTSLKISAWLIVAGSVMTVFTCRPCLSSPEMYLKVATLTSIIWLTLWFGNNYLNHAITKKLSWIDFPLARFVLGLAVTLTYSIAIIFILVLIFEYLTGFSMQKNITGTLIISITITTIITFFIQGRSFLMHWKEATIQSERFQREVMAARYESLKNQVNPHFLFNSLNALTNLVYEDPDKAAKFIKQLSDVYRYVLDTRDRELVSLEEELRFLNSYLFLQQIRFGDKLKIDQQLTFVNSQVAPLVLQMLIENAVKHNVVSEEDPLTIRFYRDGHYIVVENNVKRKKVLPEESSGVGLENIRKRYEFLTSEPVSIGETDATFAVRLPIIQSL